MMKQSTQDEINQWAVDRYASTASPSLSAAAAPAPAAPASSATGMLGATSTLTAVAGPAAPAAASAPASTWAAAASAPAAAPAPTSTATATAPKPSTAGVNVGNWYQNELGRKADPQGQAFWQAAIDSGRNPEEVYNDFTAAAVKNQENVKPVNWLSANAAANPYAPSLIGADQITQRTIDAGTETVQGQLKSVLAADSPVMQQARADAMRSAADRGMLNSSMAASGGEDAVIRSATGIATTDSGYYNNASNYNAAAQNQALMANVQAQNAATQQTQSIDAQAEQQAKSLASQQALAQMQDATTRYNAELSANTSKYNTDASYKQQMDSQKQSLANNIIANMDLSPDRKAAMLEAIGMGTSAANGQPGTGLAGAVYVIGSTAADLQSATA